MTRLSPAQRAFLSEVRFGTAATINADGSPQLTAMWYALDGDEIVMNTAVGRIKARNLRRDPRCSLCVVDGYRYLTVSGTARLDYDPARSQADIAALAVRYEGEARARQIVDRTFSKQQRVTIRFPIERVVASGIE